MKGRSLLTWKPSTRAPLHERLREAYNSPPEPQASQREVRTAGLSLPLTSTGMSLEGHLPLCRPRLALERMGPRGPTSVPTQVPWVQAPTFLRLLGLPEWSWVLPLRTSDPCAAPFFAGAASLPLLLPDCGLSGRGRTPRAEPEAGGRGHCSRATVRPRAEGVSPAGHSEDTGTGNSWGGSERWWERWKPRGGWLLGRRHCRMQRPDLPGPPGGWGAGCRRGCERGFGLAPPPTSLPILPAPSAPNPAAGPGSSPPGPVTTGHPAAVLGRPRRCRERSSRPWRGQAPWTLRAATRSCALCATRSTSARACSTASTTSAPAACAAAPPTAALPARCASECVRAPREPSAGRETGPARARTWVRGARR